MTDLIATEYIDSLACAALDVSSGQFGNVNVRDMPIAEVIADPARYICRVAVDGLFRDFPVEKIEAANTVPYPREFTDQRVYMLARKRNADMELAEAIVDYRRTGDRKGMEAAFIRFTRWGFEAWSLWMRPG